MRLGVRKLQIKKKKKKKKRWGEKKKWLRLDKGTKKV